MDHGLVAPGSAPALARMAQTGSESPSSPLWDLANSDASDPSMELVRRLAALEPPLAEASIVTRWYALSLLYLSELAIENPLPRVEDVYCAFDHPEELAEFISYMPAKHPELVRKRSREENIRAMEAAWKTWATERQAVWRDLLGRPAA